MEKAMELFRRLEQISELPRFDGATIDFHKEKPAVVFIPWVPMVAQVSNGELPAFLVSHGVRRVLVDAMWPGNVGILMELINSGIEVWVLTRASALHGWRRKGSKRPRGLVQWLRKWHPEVLKGFVEEIKRDAYDAVLLRYVKRKFMMKVTREYLECWVRMILWRRARREHQRLLQQLAVLPVSEEEKRMRIRRSEEELLEEAKVFIETTRRNYPRIDELFQRLGIENDLVAQAYCCEVFLEVDPERSVYRERNHFGLKWSNDRRVKLMRDRQALHALNQLTARVMGVNPAFKRQGFRRAMWEILKKTHKFKRDVTGLRPGASAGETRARVILRSK